MVDSPQGSDAWRCFALNAKIGLHGSYMFCHLLTHRLIRSGYIFGFADVHFQIVELGFGQMQLPWATANGF